MCHNPPDPTTATLRSMGHSFNDLPYCRAQLVASLSSRLWRKVAINEKWKNRNIIRRSEVISGIHKSMTHTPCVIGQFRAKTNVESFCQRGRWLTLWLDPDGPWVSLQKSAAESPLFLGKCFNGRPRPCTFSSQSSYSESRHAVELELLELIVAKNQQRVRAYDSIFPFRIENASMHRRYFSWLTSSVSRRTPGLSALRPRISFQVSGGV